MITPLLVNTEYPSAIIFEYLIQFAFRKEEKLYAEEMLTDLFRFLDNSPTPYHAVQQMH